jgi:hypothetical protein
MYSFGNKKKPLPPPRETMASHWRLGLEEKYEEREDLKGKCEIKVKVDRYKEN